MVWETIQAGAGKVAGFNRWPQPWNFLKNARLLMCNDQYWVMEFTFIFNLFAEFFWTNLLPSPRELERKTFTGGYRCGFYLAPGIKSPIEIIWGEGTARVVGQIAAPFVLPLFYWWAAQSAIDAFSIWETVLFPQLTCDVPTGDVLRNGDTAACPPGLTTGIPGLGDLKYDPFHICGPSQPVVLFPPGGQTTYAYWIFTAGPTGILNCKTGWQVEGVVTELQDHGAVAPLQQKLVVRSRSVATNHFSTVGSYFECTSGPSVIDSTASVAIFVADWEPEAPPDYNQNLVLPVDREPPDPRCAQSFF